MGRLLGLIAIAGLAYGGLYFYYELSVSEAIEQQLDARGFSSIEVASLDFAAMAPLSQDSSVAATLNYRGAEATLDMRVIGHPLFSDQLRLELDGLQTLRLTLGTGD
ncbi:hypothetical protein [uncultured Halomonas sp.]|uniref:hypothetical protein n=1 Tax=uncultured Halomonas sp. TaxID=173971 RepID=UPI00262CDB3D|nr:hypothetical protein [uncultured Halomonas sp.]